MNTAWDWRFEFNGVVIDFTLDLCNWLVGIAWGARDMVIWPLPCISIAIEFYDKD